MQRRQPRVAVLGAGSWGTAFSLVLADSGNDVTLWARREEVCDTINRRRENTDYLPGVELPPGVVATHDTEKALADADVVVSGGRGVGSAEGFSVIEELAALLGGAVGCSRAVTSAGWRPHTDQVGQTGTKISPDLYIPCGISGATQHMAGCKGAKKLLAINSDPEAPIMATADYAVIGDVLEIVPAISAELKRVRGG